MQEEIKFPYGIMPISITTLNELIKNLDFNEFISDGYHTFKELYTYRMLYNAMLVNEYAETGKYAVYKTKKHHDGQECFGGGWFLVVIVTPNGLIDNHYENTYWDLFKCPDLDKSPHPFDGHTPADVAALMMEVIKNEQ